MSFLFQHVAYRLPFRAPLRTAHGPWREREGWLVRLEAEDGRVGYGEIAPLADFGTETLAEAGEICRGFGGRVGPEVLTMVPERCGCVRFALGCALEGAMHGAERGARSADAEDRSADAEGRGDGAPATVESAPGTSRSTLQRWAEANAPGTSRSTLQRWAEANAPGTSRSTRRLPVAALLSAGRAALTQLPARLEEGFLALKWKVGVERMEDELGILDDLLAAIPSFAKLRLDANGGWDRRQAAKWLERCAERPIEFVEQPLGPRDEDGLRGLAGDYPVTLALDESVVRLAEARRWQSLGWPGVFVIKPAICGPLSEIEAWARQTSADVVLSSAIETVVGRASILPWALRAGVTRRALGFGIGGIFESREANGPVLGALADAGWVAGVDLAALWKAAH